MPAEHDAAVRRLGAAMRRTDPRNTEVAARLERFDAAVLVADDEGRYIAANQRAAQLTGFTVEQLLMMTVADLTPVPYASDSRGLWRDFVTAGVQKGTYQLRRRDGSVVEVHYAAWANLAPGVHVSVLSPIT
jgi:PAS domain S-box-containing protein